jgi:nicotinate-nucleotide pyrophosphorylase (carboxylating)
MDRNVLKKFTHDAHNFLNIKNSVYKQWVFRYTFLELEKDLQPLGDITTNLLIKGNERKKAVIVANEEGVIAGLAEIQYFLVDADKKFRPSLKSDFKLNFKVKDGDLVKKGEKVMEIEAEIHDLLAVERVVLNFLMRMSGVATFTRQIVDKVKKYKALIVPTRKTLWGLLDKRAVYLGGGGTHRLNLSDAILVKDNHLDYFERDFSKILPNIFSKKLDCRFVEFEVDNEAEVLDLCGKLAELIDAGGVNSICVIMLDNFKAAEIEKTLEKVKKKGFYDQFLFEASGMVSEENVEEYAKTGVDVISMGVITYGAKSLDLGMEI